MTEGASIRIKVFGQQYELKSGRVTALDAQDFRKAVGVPLSAVLAGDQEVDLDVVAGIVWMARRQRGERGLQYKEVASRLTYDTDFEIDGGPTKPEDEKADAQADKDNFPEASGA